MEILRNIDLFSVGIASAAIGILGFMVFFNNRKSATNRIFLFFSLITIFYGVSNYLNYRVESISLILWLLRITIFFAVWHAFSFFHLFYVFPEERVELSSYYRFILVPLVAAVSLLTLTPAVFIKVEKFAGIGRVTNPVRGWGILLFAAVIVYLVVGGVYTLIRKTRNSTGDRRQQLKFILGGAVITFSLIITFNFVLPVFFNVLNFIPLAPIFFFPFIALTSYAIYKHRFLDVKVVTTELLSFLLLVSTFFEILLSGRTSEIIFRSFVFIALFIFVILLIRSVRKEVEQREKLEVLSKELASANEELKRLDQAKSEFISIASHQLRTPLTIIKGYTSMLLEGTGGEIGEAAKNILGKISLSTEQLIRLVGDLLNLSRIESGKIKSELVMGDFAKMVEDAAEEFKEQAGKLGINVRFINEAGFKTHTLFDKDKMREAVFNLIDNAVKYSTRGEITARVALKDSADSGNKIVLSVEDRGIGIRKDDLGKIFNKFSRLEDARRIDPNGLGLGLYFSKKIVEEHGGKIWVESSGAGLGSSFFVEIPLTVEEK